MRFKNMSQNPDNSIPLPLKPEMALLVACARSKLTEEHKQTIRKLLVTDLNWNYVINNSIYHKVIPLLHRSLTTCFRDDVPDNVLERLNTIYKKLALSSLAISAAQINVVCLLNENRIEVLPVKGAVLAEKLYGSVAMRTYSDVDILVYQKDIGNAINRLQENGYTLWPQGIPRSTFMKFLKYYHHGRLLDKNGVLIELHWELSGFYTPAPMTLESLRPFLIKAEFNNYPTLDLTNEMLLVYLCLHGNKHRWEKLDYICSVAELLISRNGLDWVVVLDSCRQLKMTKRLLLALSLSKKLFSVRLPPAIDEMVSTNLAINKLTDITIARELHPSRKIKEQHPFQKSLRFQFAVFDSKVGAIKFLVRSMVCPEQEDWGEVRLPLVLFFLYFLYKPYCVIIKPINNRIKLLIGI